MDRRTRRSRFIPTSEGLEGRQLLAASAATNPAAATAVANPTATTTTIANPYSNAGASGSQIDGGAAVADTIEAKLQHIQNYPFFIGQLNKDGAVPQPEVGNIQDDLRALIGTMGPGSTDAVRQFNLDLRDMQKHYNVLPDQAVKINSDFGAVLQAAGADPAITADLQKQMNAMVQEASKQPTPSIVVRNEYATTLQLALGTGRPLLAPAKPRLATGNRAGTANGLDVTGNPQPTLGGTYAAGTNIQIVDANNTVFGTATTDASGNYSVRFANPLPNGTYTVRVRAQDDGYYSAPSKSYTFTVKAKAPVVAATAAAKKV